MQLYTTVPIKKQPNINYNSRILMLGSCFAENIGKKLLQNKFNIEINPFGIVYNPLSIVAILDRLLQNKKFDKNELFEYQGIWNSFLHHSKFSTSNIEETLENINHQYNIGVEQLNNATHLILTFGSSYIYEYNGTIVNNCHKLPTNNFNERQTTINEIVEKITTCLNKIKQINNSIEIVITISPVRYLGKGAHQGQINKATLLLATEQLVKTLPYIQYFPSYEIMLDELRDYRFYTDDMVHPSALAIEYIWQRFAETYFSQETIELANEINKINKSLSHRPLHPDSKEYKIFTTQLNNKINKLESEYPQIKFK